MPDAKSSNPDNLWSTLLQEVHQNAVHRQNVYGGACVNEPQVIVLGGEQAGKTRLISSWKKSNDIYSGVGMEYHCFNIDHQKKEDDVQLRVWCLDGDFALNGLIKFALTEENIWQSLAVICLNMASPWTMLDDLQFWLNVIKQHVHRLKLKSGELSELQCTVENCFNQYVEPSIESSGEKADQDAHDEQTFQFPVSLSTRRQTVTPALGDTEWAYSILHPPSLLARRHGDSGKEVAQGNGEVSPDALGVPIMVVVTKTDSLIYLERENRFTDEHFDLIQWHLRKICLSRILTQV